MGLGLLVKSYFSSADETTKPNDTIQVLSQSPTVNNVVKDSATQTINQVTQSNSNKGDVKNEFISGDKKSYTYNQSKKSDTVIVNNGILNNGGTGNTYNQTINPDIPQRHFTNDSFAWFNNNLPKKAKYFTVTIYNHDQESATFANEIFDFLQAKQFVAAMTPAGQIFSQVPKDKLGQIDVALSSDSTLFQMTIYPLK